MTTKNLTFEERFAWPGSYVKIVTDRHIKYVLEKLNPDWRAIEERNKHAGHPESCLIFHMVETNLATADVDVTEVENQIAYVEEETGHSLDHLLKGNHGNYWSLFIHPPSNSWLVVIFRPEALEPDYPW